LSPQGDELSPSGSWCICAPALPDVLTFMKELSDNQKATILYDTLPNYYIKRIKEANTEPIEINLKKLFQFALNIEDAVINPGNYYEANLGIAKIREPKPQFLGSRARLLQRRHGGGTSHRAPDKKYRA
jgi:hypothetical protein